MAGVSTIIFNLFKQVTDAKDERIKYLEGNIISLEKGHSERVRLLEEMHNREIDNLHRELESRKRELSEMGSFREIVESFFEDLSSQEITPETRTNLKKIETLLADIDRNQDILKSTRTAAQWLNYKKEAWALKLAHSASAKYPDLVKSGQFEAFRVDILKYMDWIYDSLTHGFTCRIEDYVRTPSIRSPFPYRAAFQELAEINDFGQLSESEVRDLQDYVAELSRRALT